MSTDWINKSENEIRDDIVLIAKEETGLSNFKGTGVLRGFIETIARVVFAVYQNAINPIYNNASLDSASGFFLSLWGLMLGVVRKQPVKTSGIFTGSAYGEGTIKEGTSAVIDGTSLRFKVSGDVSFKTCAEFTIPVIAEQAGAAYNIASGMALRFTRVINGLDNISVKENWISEAGQNVEDDDTYRARIKSRWKGQVLGDTKEVYRFYAQEVVGVRDVRIVRTPRGAGSTDVIIAAENGQPSDELLQKVKDALYTHELMAFDVQVKRPRIMTINVTIEFTGNMLAGEVEIIAASYVQKLGISGRFKISDLYDLYKPYALKTIEIISPDRDVQPDNDTVIEAVIKANKLP